MTAWATTATFYATPIGIRCFVSPLRVVFNIVNHGALPLFGWYIRALLHNRSMYNWAILHNRSMYNWTILHNGSMHDWTINRTILDDWAWSNIALAITVVNVTVCLIIDTYATTLYRNANAGLMIATTAKADIVATPLVAKAVVANLNIRAGTTTTLITMLAKVVVAAVKIMTCPLMTTSTAIV